MNPGSDDSPAGDALSAYRAKRSPDRTPEPFSGVSPVSGRSFVVHKHAARNMHFDLRLEMDGVLRSWAVPRGPSYDMADKRLAVHVEDHPLEYGDFEGIIPAGNYGAGGVIVWDRGEWIALEDYHAGLEKGKLLFELRGYKLHGKWTLVKIKKGERDWLLIKERDGFVKSPGDQFVETSVLSGLTVEEVKAGVTASGKLRERIAGHSGVARARVDPRSVKLMLAEPEEKAFTRDGWLFELKLDGYRLLASKARGEALLLSRNGNDYTTVFPEIARAVRALPLESCVLDGEVVVLDREGKPSFSRLQQRGRLTSPLDVRRAAVELPATLYTFDLLGFEDFDLRPLPLRARKELLAIAIPALGPLRPLDHIEREGEAFLQSVSAMGLEGIIAKKADAPYRGGRGKVWLKIKAEPTDDFVIVGYTEPKKSRGHFGALQLADMVDGSLVYAGRVGTGFNDALLAEIMACLKPIVRDTPPCLGPVHESADGPLPAEAIPETKTTSWVEPRLCCEVRFREWTPDGLLRHAAFVRLRPDKDPHDCVRQPSISADVQESTAVETAPSNALDNPKLALERSEGSPAFLRASSPLAKRAPSRGEGLVVTNTTAVTSAHAVTRATAITNASKVFWPQDGFTKGDLIEYYRAISPWLLPYLRNRPVVMTRFPDGIDGKSFYQKDAPDFAPDWLRTHAIWSEDTQRDIRYFVADDVESIVYLANMGTIPLHMWLSRIGTLEQPDWCVIDLDPKEAPFSDVIRCALVLRALCESIGLPSYVKTTGKTGLHVILPLGRQCTYEQSRTMGELIARVMLREVGDIATIVRHVTKRGDKVYLDYLQNRRGQLIVTPFSVRPLPGATVSMPLNWDEVDSSLDPKRYTIRNAVERMESLGADPVLPALEEKPDLAGVLQRLAAVLAG
jgi:bifunctional non-homologous end joining protein LigD